MTEVLPRYDGGGVGLALFCRGATTCGSRMTLAYIDYNKSTYASAVWSLGVGAAPLGVQPALLASQIETLLNLH
jgi:hypothetical protein